MTALMPGGDYPELAECLWPGELVSWSAQGLCAQVDPELFFPEKGGSTREAKRVCQECPVRAQCLEYALANDERFGIWGGCSERERRRLKASAGTAVADAVEQVPVDQVAGVDAVVVARLMAGHPAPGASRAEVAAAAIGLHGQGRPTKRIAAVLTQVAPGRVHARQVDRWLDRHRAGLALCPGSGHPVVGRAS